MIILIGIIIIIIIIVIVIVIVIMIVITGLQAPRACPWRGSRASSGCAARRSSRPGA